MHQLPPELRLPISAGELRLESAGMSLHPGLGDGPARLTKRSLGKVTLPRAWGSVRERTDTSERPGTHTHTAAAAVSLARSRGTEIASDSNFGRFGLSACACVVHGSSPSSQSKMHVQHAKHTHSSAFGEPTTSTAESRACHVAQAAGLSTSTRACRNTCVWRSRKVMHADCQDAFGAEQCGDGLSGWGRLKDEWRGQRS